MMRFLLIASVNALYIFCSHRSNTGVSAGLHQMTPRELAYVKITKCHSNVLRDAISTSYGQTLAVSRALTSVVTVSLEYFPGTKPASIKWLPRLLPSNIVKTRNIAFLMPPSPNLGTLAGVPRNI